MYKVKVDIKKYGYFDEKISFITKNKYKAYFLYYLYRCLMIGTLKYKIKIYKVQENLIYMNKKTYFWNN